METIKNIVRSIYVKTYNASFRRAYEEKEEKHKNELLSETIGMINNDDSFRQTLIDGDFEKFKEAMEPKVGQTTNEARIKPHPLLNRLMPVILKDELKEYRTNNTNMESE